MSISVSTIIERPPEVVFDFCVVNHLRNHPRWDPKMQLEQLTEGPVGLGTRFRRRHTRIGIPVEGAMEVTEFEPNRTFGTVIHDMTPNGPLEVRSRMTLERVGEARTELTVHLELPGVEATMDPGMVEASLRRMKELIESET